MKTSKIKNKPKIGDWVFITGSLQIRQDYWDKQYPRGIFGRVIKIDIRYSQFDGKKRPDTIWIRACRPKGERPHYKTHYQYLNPAF